MVDCDRLDVTFEDIAGMEGVKGSLQEIISEPLDLPPELYPVGHLKRSIEKTGRSVERRVPLELLASNFPHDDLCCCPCIGGITWPNDSSL